MFCFCANLLRIHFCHRYVEMAGRDRAPVYYYNPPPPTKVRPASAGYYIPGASPRYVDPVDGNLNVVKGDTPLVYRRKKPTYIKKMRTCLRGLAITNLVLAILITVLGCACVGVGYAFARKCWNNYGVKVATSCPPSPINCEAGTAIWQGLFAVFTSGIGVGALAHARNRCMVISYQVR